MFEVIYYNFLLLFQFVIVILQSAYQNFYYILQLFLFPNIRNESPETLLHNQIFHHTGKTPNIFLIDVNTEKAKGEALDIKQATPFIDNCDIYAGTYADAVGSDIVIVTSGIGRKPGQSRLELVQTNVGIVKGLGLAVRDW